MEDAYPFNHAGFVLAASFRYGDAIGIAAAARRRDANGYSQRIRIRFLQYELSQPGSGRGSDGDHDDSSFFLLRSLIILQ